MTPALRASCLGALVAAAHEVCDTALGGALGGRWDAASGPATVHGAYLSMTAAEQPIQAGLLVAPRGCQFLAKALLGISAEADELPDADVSDAMCEIINMVAGGLKRRLDSELHVTLGLPMFVCGHLLANPHQTVASRSLTMGAVPVTLILVTRTMAL